MSKEYVLKPKHSLGKTVYVIANDTYGDKKPKVFTGKVSQIKAILSDTEIDSEPILQYRVKLAESYREDGSYFDFQLLTKSEAERRYEQYCKELKTFDDIYLRTMLGKAKKLLKAYEK